tara:strand:- start:2576 stop:4726 length:2151 start_codon:yes stop_codon:yes gene_type:complete
MRVRYKKKSHIQRKELSAGYYLEHFQIIMDHILKYYGNDPTVVEFLNFYNSLSRDEKLFTVKLSSLKISVYRTSKKYCLDINHESVIFQNFIKEGHFISIDKEFYFPLVAQLTKSELVHMLTLNNVPFKKSLRVGELKELALHLYSQERMIETCFYRFKFETSFQYIYFLYFGKLDRNVQVLAQSELGFRKTNKHFRSDAARFSSEQNIFYFFQLKKAISCLKENKIGFSDEEKKYFHQILQKPYTDVKTEELFNILLDLVIKKFHLNNLEKLTLLKRATMFPAKKLYITFLAKENLLDELRNILKDTIEFPHSEEEFHYCFNLYNKKFKDGKQLSIRTAILKESQQISIDEAFLQSPENGAKYYFEKQGYVVRRFENYIWRALFGLVFWEEIFEDERSQFFTEFDRLPNTILENTFAQVFRSEIDQKLSSLDHPQFPQELLKKITRLYGRDNSIFRWKNYLFDRIKELWDHSPPGAIAQVLSSLVDNYLKNNDGFPDLALYKKGKVKLIEIKTLTDQLRLNQMNQIETLNSAGFEVEVIRCDYKFNPDQTYCVIDVETTGGRANFHRITEIGVVKIKNGEVIDTFESLINPERSIPIKIQQLTGINNDMVANAPTFDEIKESLMSIFEGSIFVAHNVRFDYSFIQREFKRAGIDFTMPTFCTCSQSRKHFKGLKSYSLKNLCREFNIDLTQHHRAMCDAHAAAQILNRINESRSI